jgi:hypothetical protein
MSKKKDTRIYKLSMENFIDVTKRGGIKVRQLQTMSEETMFRHDIVRRIMRRVRRHRLDKKWCSNYQRILYQKFENLNGTDVLKGRFNNKGKILFTYEVRLAPISLTTPCINDIEKGTVSLLGSKESDMYKNHPHMPGVHYGRPWDDVPKTVQQEVDNRIGVLHNKLVGDTQRKDAPEPATQTKNKPKTKRRGKRKGVRR